MHLLSEIESANKVKSEEEKYAQVEMRQFAMLNHSELQTHATKKLSTRPTENTPRIMNGNTYHECGHWKETGLFSQSADKLFSLIYHYQIWSTRILNFSSD